MSLLIVTDDETRCCECDRLLRRGSVYSERLLGVCDGIPVLDEICLTCSGVPT